MMIGFVIGFAVGAVTLWVIAVIKMRNKMVVSKLEYDIFEAWLYGIHQGNNEGIEKTWKITPSPKSRYEDFINQSGKYL
jgi:hypothetical protein